MIRSKFTWMVCLALAWVGCKPGKEKQTKSGMKYTVYRELNGKKPHVGDWVTVQMVYKEENDSVLFDSRPIGKPLRFALPAPKFQGSFEEGLLQLGEGDSATFFVNADSMFLKVISKDPEASFVRRPRPGSFLKFDVALLRVQPYQEAEVEIAMDESRQEKAELKTLEEYIKEKELVVDSQPEGYYLKIEEAGKGKSISSGDRVSLNFTGRFLNGVEFDSNSSSGKPYTFKLGNGEVIKGWELAFLKLHEGDKAMLIVPSTLGYGSEGLKRPNSMTYVIPPFSTLVFEIEVLKQEPVAKN